MASSTRNALAFSVVAVFAAPLPANGIVFEFPPASNLKDTQARVLWAHVSVTKSVGGALLQSVSVHTETGALLFSAGISPPLVAASALPQDALALAGPEQARVPFFTPNVLLGTFPKDCYCLPGYSIQLNNFGALAGTSAVCTVFFERDGE